MFTYMLPKPIPAILAESPRWPTNIIFTRSINIEKTMVIDAGRATRARDHTMLVTGSFSSVSK